MTTAGLDLMPLRKGEKIEQERKRSAFKRGRADKERRKMEGRGRCKRSFSGSWEEKSYCGTESERKRKTAQQI